MALNNHKPTEKEYKNYDWNEWLAGFKKRTDKAFNSITDF